jgi:hypothetical protein
VQGLSVFEEGRIQLHAVDNSVGITDSVVAGTDRWNRRQLNTFVVSDRVGRIDYPTDHWSPGRCLAATTIPDCAFFWEGFQKKGGSMRYEDEIKGKGKQIGRGQ